MKANPVALILLLAAALMFGARLFGPSALQRFDQPRTVAYTADIAANGHWLLPHDTLGHPATKPPLVNWLAVPLIKAGCWTEWALKLPMLLASIVTILLTVIIARRLFASQLPPEAAPLAGLAWLVTSPNMTMIYHCRPDPVLIALLTAGWLCATIILDEKREPPLAVIAGFWISIGLACLTKGPPALLPLLYLALGARLLGGRWALLHRSRWWWGLPLSLLIVLAWAVPCAVRYPDAFFGQLLGHEVFDRVFNPQARFGLKAPPPTILRVLGSGPLWFVQRFLPWSLFTLGALILIGWRRWFRHELAPAILWLLLVLVFFSFSIHKTADYIQTAYPAAAVLAAWFCATALPRLRLRPIHVALVALLAALGLCLEFVFFSAVAHDRRGENVKTFAREVRVLVQEEPVVFANTGYNTLQFFLHRHQPHRLPLADEVTHARWAILPVIPELPATAVSGPLPIQPYRKSVTLGLYPIETVRAQLAALK